MKTSVGLLIFASGAVFGGIFTGVKIASWALKQPEMKDGMRSYVEHRFGDVVFGARGENRDYNRRR